MNLTEYNAAVIELSEGVVCKSDGVFRKYQDKINTLENSSDKYLLEETLIPSMGLVLPFITSSISFSNSVFGKFLGISHEHKEEDVVRGFKRNFSDYLSSNLNDLHNLTYKNAENLFNIVDENLTSQGLKNTDNAVKFKEGLHNGSLSREDVLWLNSSSCIDVSILISKDSYCFHIGEAYNRAKDNLAELIDMYAFSKELDKKPDEVIERYGSL